MKLERGVCYFYMLTRYPDVIFTSAGGDACENVNVQDRLVQIHLCERMTESQDI